MEMGSLVPMTRDAWTVLSMSITGKVLPTVSQELQARALKIAQGYYPICMVNSKCKCLMLSTS